MSDWRALSPKGPGSPRPRELLQNTKRDPRVGLSIIAMADPYVETQIRGRVVERRPDPSSP